MSNEVEEAAIPKAGPRLRSILVWMAGLSLLGDLGVILSVVGVPVTLVLGFLFPFALLAFLCGVVFGRRGEPAQRLVDVIKAFREK